MPSKPKLHQPSAADVAALLSGMVPTERPVPLCMKGDLQADYEMLERDLVAAQAAAGDSLADAAVEDVKARMAVLRDEIRAATLVFRIRGLPKPVQVELERDNPAREDNKGDKDLGYNTEAVDQAMVRMGCVWPELSDEQWTALFATATVWQRRQLSAAAYAAGFQESPVSF